MIRQEVPAELSGYRWEGPLGSGTFGEVWAATQERTGLKVAVKLLASNRGLNWHYFRHELSILLEVAEHPHVVTLLDADLSSSRPYLVMPLLSGGTLADHRLPGRPGQLVKALRWLEQIALALHYTHRKGILHCDLKPSNVLLDDEENCRLADFGQSLQMGEGGGSLGTLGFMAPEQLQSHPLSCGEASSSPDVSWDVYGWGAIGYFLLTGSAPRLGEEDCQTLLGLPADQQLSSLYQALRERPLIPVRTLHDGVDEDLAQLLESCLHWDPSRRPESMAGVLADLRRRRSGSPLLCRRPWDWRYRLDRFVRKPMVAVSLMVPFLFLLFVNTYLTVNSMDSLYREVFHRLRSVNAMAVQALNHKEGALWLASPEYRHFKLTAEGEVLQSWNASPAPTRLVWKGLRASGYFRPTPEGEVMGVVSPVEGGFLATEVDGDKAEASIQDLRWRNLALTLLTVLVTLWLALVAFRVTSADEEQGLAS